MISRATLLIAVLCVVAQAQDKPNPCAQAELKASMLEAQLTTEKIRASAANARREGLEGEVSKNGARASNAEQRLGVEARKSAALTAENERLKAQLAERDKVVDQQAGIISEQKATIATRTAERDRERRGRKAANKRTWAAAIIAAALGVLGASR
jgi:hypothetical protein